MVVNREQALSLCKKFLDEETLVRLQFESPFVSGRFTGKVAKVSDEAIVLMPSDFTADDDPASLIAIPLTFVRAFAFADPREGGSAQELLKDELEFGIMIFFESPHALQPLRGQCILYELTNPA
jgi:hypothetical protein